MLSAPEGPGGGGVGRKFWANLEKIGILDELGPYPLRMSMGM